MRATLDFRSFFRAALTLAALALAPTLARAQITFNSQLRTIAVSGSAGNNSASTAVGDFGDFNTSVAVGAGASASTVGVVSSINTGALFFSTNFDLRTPGFAGNPTAAAQAQVVFTLASPTGYILEVSDSFSSGAAQTSIGTDLSGPGGTIVSGRTISQTGTLPAGTYTISTVVQCANPGGVLGNAFMTLSFTSPNDTATSILYQGRLADNGTPANGPFDMTFQVFNASTGGTALTTAIFVPRVQVTNGVFSTLVNIPPSVWNAGRTYLECAVGFPVTVPIVLSPRQPVQPTPKAIWALLADAVPWSGITGIPASITNPPWAQVGSDLAYTGGRVGIGVSPPAAPLHVRSGSAGITPQSGVLAAFEGSNGGYLSLLSANGSETGILFGRPAVGTAGAGIIYNNPRTPGGLQFRTDTNNTRLTIANTGAAAFTGTVTAPNFAYASPITSSEMVAYISFRARNGTPVRNIAAVGEGAGFDNGVSNEQLTAELDLPNGATLTNLRFYFYDNSGADLFLSVLAYFPGTPTNILLGSGGSSSSTNASRFIDIPLNTVVDNSNAAILLAVSSTTNTWDTSMQVRAVRATYTMPRPVP
jgi:hypothetical protein